MVVAIPTPVEIPCGYCDRKFHKENDKNDVAALVDHWEYNHVPENGHFPAPKESKSPIQSRGNSPQAVPVNELHRLMKAIDASSADKHGFFSETSPVSSPQPVPVPPGQVKRKLSVGPVNEKKDARAKARKGEPTESHICQECGKSFPLAHPSKLKRHEQSHKGLTQKCPRPRCIQYFRTREDAQAHWNANHAPT